MPVHNTGNPLTYPGGFTFTWQGKQLVGAAQGNNVYSFTYNESGLRTSKTVNGVTTNYYWVGSLLAGEEKNGNFTRYLYDANDSPVGIQYHSATSSENAWTTYWLESNLQGDIIALYNNQGTKLVSYTYDAFGNCTATTLGTGASSLANSRNPFRYRGYYYDKDLEMYYLQSRYYDQKTGRFISPDSVDYLDPSTFSGLNLYAYCNNNPVMYADPSGHFAISTLIISTIIGAAVGFGSSVLSQSLTGDKEINWGQVAFDTVMGGISGALGASGINKVVSIIAGGVLGAAGSVGGDLIASGGDWSQVNVGKAILMGAIGVISGNWTGAGTQNSRAMVKAINAGESWGSKAFLTSAKEALLRPNSGLTLQTMYMNMAKAISLYTIHGITKVSGVVFGTTFLGNMIGW